MPDLRPAAADDLQACVPLIVAAGGALLTWGLVDASADICAQVIARCWRSERHPLGAHHATVAVVSGTIAGCAIGAPTEAWTEGERRAPIPLHDLIPDAHTLHARARQQRQARPTLPLGSFYLASLAVAPGWRRRGLGRQLVDAVVARAGARPIVVEVEATNHGAYHLYDRCGFRPTVRWSVPGGPGMVRLRRTVSPGGRSGAWPSH